jgi:hypothetical protein
MSGRSRLRSRSRFEETSVCRNEKLEKFSRMQYSYINQVFGDRTVRGYISALYPNPNYRFFVELTAKYDRHHVLKKIPQEPGTGTTKPKPKREFWCSVDNGLQDDRINENDTFCQTYTLMEYLHVPIPEDQKEKQMEMIRMYRDLLSRKDFIEGRVVKWTKKGNPKKTLHGLSAIDTSAWKDTTDGTEKDFPTEIDDIVEKIEETLDEWEAYGYHYFIGNGQCPPARGRPGTLEPAPESLDPDTLRGCAPRPCGRGVLARPHHALLLEAA